MKKSLYSATLIKHSSLSSLHSSEEENIQSLLIKLIPKIIHTLLYSPLLLTLYLHTANEIRCDLKSLDCALATLLTYYPLSGETYISTLSVLTYSCIISLFARPFALSPRLSLPFSLEVE